MERHEKAHLAVRCGMRCGLNIACSTNYVALYEWLYSRGCLSFVLGPKAGSVISCIACGKDHVAQCHLTLCDNGLKYLVGS
jgi:hypothetical protein